MVQECAESSTHQFHQLPNTQDSSFHTLALASSGTAGGTAAGGSSAGAGGSSAGSDGANLGRDPAKPRSGSLWSLFSGGGRKEWSFGLGLHGFSGVHDSLTGDGRMGLDMERRTRPGGHIPAPLCSWGGKG